MPVGAPSKLAEEVRRFHADKGNEEIFALRLGEKIIIRRLSHNCA